MYPSIYYACVREYHVSLCVVKYYIVIPIEPNGLKTTLDTPVVSGILNLTTTQQQPKKPEHHMIKSLYTLTVTCTDKNRSMELDFVNEQLALKARWEAMQMGYTVSNIEYPTKIVRSFKEAQEELGFFQL